jgi:hypothetical protein
MAQLADGRDRQARLKVTPSVANFVLIHFPLEKGKTSADADAFLTKRGLVLRALEQLRPAACAAHDHRHRGGQPPGGRWPARLHGGQVSATRRSSTASR